MLWAMIQIDGDYIDAILVIGKSAQRLGSDRKNIQSPDINLLHRSRN